MRATHLTNLSTCGWNIASFPQIKQTNSAITHRPSIGRMRGEAFSFAGADDVANLKVYTLRQKTYSFLALTDLSCILVCSLPRIIFPPNYHQRGQLATYYFITENLLIPISLARFRLPCFKLTQTYWKWHPSQPGSRFRHSNPIRRFGVWRSLEVWHDARHIW